MTVKRGRKAKISDKIINNLRKEASHRDLSKNSFTRASFKKTVNEKLKAEADSDPSLPVGQNITISEKTIKRRLKDIAPEISSTADVQNKRRKEALQDGYNPVSLAALWPAVIGAESAQMLINHQDNIRIVNPDLLYNTDETSLLVGEKKIEQVYLARGSKEKLRKNNLSIGTTANKSLPEQERSVHLVVTTNASGELVHTVIKIKDDAIPKVTKFEVC